MKLARRLAKGGISELGAIFYRLEKAKKTMRVRQRAKECQSQGSHRRATGEGYLKKWLERTQVAVKLLDPRK